MSDLAQPLLSVPGYIPSEPGVAGLLQAHQQAVQAANVARGWGGGGPSERAALPPTPRPQMLFIEPSKLEALQQKGLISKDTLLQAKARMGMLDAKLGLNPAQGYSQMAQPSGTVAPPAGPAPVGVGGATLGAPSPTPQQRPKPQKKLSPEEQAWLSLAGKIQWADPAHPSLLNFAHPGDVDLGADYGGKTQLRVNNLPPQAQALLKETPGAAEQFKKGMVPIGWPRLDSLNPQEKVVLIRLMLLQGKQMMASQAGK